MQLSFRRLSGASARLLTGTKRIRLAMPEKPIYRFMNFFELYGLIVHRELKFSKLRLMQDKNEGLGEVIRMQSRLEGFNLRNSRHKIAEYHSEVLERNYLSCWTSTPDSMAMWLLYSSDFSAIRVRTTSKKLESLLEGATSTTYEVPLAAETGTLLPRVPTIAEVRYADFRALHQLSKDVLLKDDQAVREYLKREQRSGTFPSPGDAPAELHHGRFLKDCAFAHESEIRATFIGEVRNSMTTAEFENLPDTLGKVMGHPLMSIATKDNSPSVYAITVGADFIEEICFDPRMPSYRKDEMLRMLGSTEIPIVPSNAFGYILADSDLTVPENVW